VTGAVSLEILFTKNRKLEARGQGGRPKEKGKVSGNPAFREDSSDQFISGKGIKMAWAPSLLTKGEEGSANSKRRSQNHIGTEGGSDQKRPSGPTKRGGQTERRLKRERARGAREKHKRGVVKKGQGGQEPRKKNNPSKKRHEKLSASDQENAITQSTTRPRDTCGEKGNLTRNGGEVH